MAEVASLSPQQRKALFDILTHRETYKEIEDFKTPGAIQNYGPPFQNQSTPCNSPILQSLLSKFILILPGLRDVPTSFWTEQVQSIIQELAEAELSESYDKGMVGIRKTLATAIAALIEYPARASMGGFSKDDTHSQTSWSPSNPQDVLESWQAGGQEIVYGDLLDRLFDKVAETNDLTAHEPMVQCLHEFLLVNIASIMHYTLILSPEGPTIVRMAEGVHRLIPYAIVRQTLKIGNVATMLSAMMRVILAKVSVASVTNWIGLSSGANEGMNLMQQIMNQVLNWDKREFKRRADKIEKAKDAPPKAVLAELRSWIDRPRAEHEECRRRSQEQGMSIVAVILALSPNNAELSDQQHEQAAEYLALHLAVRDRQEIVRVLCQRHPDLLSAAVKAGVDAYTPMIRHVHQAVDLSDSMWDSERFITDMLKVAKPTGSPGNLKQPDVEDFVDLLHRHQGSLHKFLHQVAKNGKEITAWFREWAGAALAQFRNDQKPPETKSVISGEMIHGGIDRALSSAFAELSEDDRKAVVAELDAHSRYIDELHAASAARISDVIKRTRSAPFGPGAYLARWQQLMDNAPITPATANGPVRHGSNESVKNEARKTASGEQIDVPADTTPKSASNALPAPPSSEHTLQLLADKFRSLLTTTS